MIAKIFNILFKKSEKNQIKIMKKYQEKLGKGLTFYLSFPSYRVNHFKISKVMLKNLYEASILMTFKFLYKTCQYNRA